MQNTNRMVARLPECYQAFRSDSLIYTLMGSIGRVLDEAEQNISAIMKSKWIDVAYAEDLERLSALFGIEKVVGEGPEEFRKRLRSTIHELLAGAGTVESVRRLVQATIGVRPELIENPKVLRQSEEYSLKAGDGWVVTNRSVKPDNPILIIKALNDTKNPSFINLSTEDSITYHGIIEKGQYLVIHPDCKGYLAGMEVTDKITSTSGMTPTLSKKESRWRYTDANAFFDHAKFDQFVFAAGEQVHNVSVQLKYEESQPAVFVVRIPLYIKKDERGFKVVGYEKELRQEVRRLVDNVKPAGVLAKINYWDELSEKLEDQRDILTPMLSSVNIETHELKEEVSIDVDAGFTEEMKLQDIFATCGAFDITTFNSKGNRFG